MRHLGLSFKIIISLISAAALVYIFFIDDYVGLLNFVFPGTSTEETDNTETSGITIDIPSSILYYENTGNFDFMQDVSAHDAEGNDITSEVQYTIKSGNSIENKKIEYFITRNGATACSAERDFSIPDYSGPTIAISSAVTIHATESSDLVNKMIELGVLSASDGLGNDITASVTYTSESALNTAGTYPVKFNVTNYFNDTYSLVYDVSIVGSTTDPVVALTTTSVTLPIGAEFNWRNYLDYATDPVEGDISNRIYIKDNINNLVPGVYTVTYIATNSKGVSSTPAELTVIIKAN